MTVDGDLERKLLWSGDEGYEQARHDVVWNGRKPPRRPAGIVQAEDAEDVAAAVRLAKERDLQVSVRAGGHSTSAAGLREGALLVDVSRLTSIDIDAQARTAVVGPGVRGRDLDVALDPLGLFFPHGHCSSVAVSGFLLGGAWDGTGVHTGPGVSWSGPSMWSRPTARWSGLMNRRTAISTGRLAARAPGSSAS